MYMLYHMEFYSCIKLFFNCRVKIYDDKSYMRKAKVCDPWFFFIYDDLIAFISNVFIVLNVSTYLPILPLLIAL